MPDPVILSAYDPGVHNADLSKTVSRLSRERAWKDLSCVIVTPTGHGSAPHCCWITWLNLIKPPNNKCTHLLAVGAEVGEAYSRTIEGLLAHPELSKWKYVLTLEHDQSVPADGLIKLLLQMEGHPEFAAIGGLYFTKGVGGCAQIWGDAHDPVLNFRPQVPRLDGGLVECNGLGMGFTIFRLSMFRDERLRRPWFKTAQSKEDGVGTQDLYFFSNARQFGYRCAVDCSVRVGHWDGETMW